MNLSMLSVKYAVTTSMLFLIAVGFGTFGLMRLPLDLFPDISFPVVVVITTYSGASPEDMETLVTRPIEGAVAAVKDTEEIASSSRQGISMVTAKFSWGKDMAQAETDVRRSLEFIKSVLPEDVDNSMVFAFDPSLQPVVMMVMTGPYPLDELRRIAVKEVQPRIERLPGIASSEVAGGLKREVHVVLDPVKIAAFGLDVNAVIGSVYQGNVQSPGGSLQQGTLDFTIQTHGKYSKVSDIAEVVVGARQTARGPVPLLLKEVAVVQDTFDETQRVLEVNGVPTIWLLVRKQSGANTVRAANTVTAALPEIKKATAAQIEFLQIFNQADYINASLGNLSSTGLIGIIVTFLTLLFFLRDVRSSLIVAVAIPVSVITTFWVMDAAHMTLNILSMAGLALAIGMLVDNSIVVLENIYRLRVEGLAAWEASIQGAKGVTMAVTASTLTTIAVFLPVLYVPGIAGVMFKDMAVTICYSLMASLVVSLTLVPLAASRLLHGARSGAVLARAYDADPLKPVRGIYRRSLTWVLKHRWVAAAGVVGMLVVTGLMTLILATDFMHDDDNSMVVLQFETAVGNNVQEAAAIMHELVGRIDKTIRPEERKLVATDVGVGEGFVAMFAKGPHAGMIRVPLVSPDHRQRKQRDIETELRKVVRDIPGLSVSVGQEMNMFGGQGDVEIQIRGHDLEVSRQVGLALKEQLTGLREVASVAFSMQDQKPEVRVDLDRPKLAALGLSSAAVGSAVSAAFMGRIAGRFADGGDEYDILVRFAKEHRNDTDELRKMPIVTMSSESVPLANIAKVGLTLAPTDITRLDQARVTRLNVTLKPTWVDEGGSSHIKDMGGAIQRIDKILAAYVFPNEFTYHIGGTAEDFASSFRYLGWALLISVFLVYMVMASQFESFREPFIIMFTVPLAAVGVVPIFVLTGSSLDMAALLGVIMLVGIVVNNGIVMVDAANRLREKFPERKAAALAAAQQRLRPVLLTALTTIFSMVPLALEIGEGAAGWGGLAKAVIGGLSVATFLTLYFVPVIYSVFAPKVAVAHTEKPIGAEVTAS
jgi:hydrophobic/amphiphilic exporter-1 (mainly G- bacteria), HAE1 family